jgi:uncharacterized Fe-S radical SAM superfamily protein PflX
LLDGIVDVYLPDLKYADSDAGFQYSKVRDYTTHARAAINEMHRQMGDELALMTTVCCGAACSSVYLCFRTTSPVSKRIFVGSATSSVRRPRSR